MVKKYVKPVASVEEFSTENYVASLCEDLKEWEEHPYEGAIQEHHHFYVDGEYDGAADDVLIVKNKGKSQTSAHFTPGQTQLKIENGHYIIRWAWWTENIDGMAVGTAVPATDERYAPFRVIQMHNGQWIGSNREIVITPVERS